jgi:hypothetical protein
VRKASSEFEAAVGLSNEDKSLGVYGPSMTFISVPSEPEMLRGHFMFLVEQFTRSLSTENETSQCVGVDNRMVYSPLARK